jgi:FAD/FMN-containing dehydrogenase
VPAVIAAPSHITSAALLRSQFTGPLLRAGDPGYDQARRVWNGMFDRRPALIARCRCTADAAAAVRYATAAGLPVTVRGGGHNVAGTAVADGAVLIDLSLMRRVTVDAGRRLAHAEGGCLLGDLDAATAPHGLACPAGVVSHTGVGGLALGGGYGWLARRWGLTCDHIAGAEVVLADGSVVAAEDHPDLLWALRGGGGNFGIVTRFTLRLRPAGPVYRHVGMYPAQDAPAALAAYRDFAEAQPDDMHAVGALQRASAPWLPAALRDRPALFLTTVWLGDPAAGAQMTAPLLAAAPPAAQTAGVLSHLELQALGDHSEPHGHRYYTRSCYLAELTGEPAAELVRAAVENPSALSCIDFEYLGGAIAAGDPDSAFPRRDAPYICTASAHWTDRDRHRDATHIAWARGTVDRLARWQHGGNYVNYMQAEPAGKIAELYGATRYARLAAVKRRYDPDNVFRANQNIRPQISNDPSGVNQ